MAPAARLSRPKHLLVLVYWGGAALLLPWIVLLYFEQAPRGLAHRIHLIGVGVSVLMIAGMVATAVWCRHNSHFTVVAGVFTATVAFVTAWFATVTSTGGRFDEVFIYVPVVQLPVAVLCAWTVRRLYRPHGAHAAPPARVPLVLMVAAVIVVPVVAVIAGVAPSVAAAHHLRIVWVGLDVFELIGMAATGWCLRRSLPSVAVAGALTGSLLFCDAWFDVVPTTGRVEVEGILMALVELPLAALSFLIAFREVAGWPEASPRPPALRRRRGY
jgi:uncharacterized membrane protein (UPF0136 family)